MVLIQQLNIKQFLDKATYLPLIDVRSPAEYERGHIPGAVNIPVFDNDERAEVGTMYKQVGRDKAILLGLRIVEGKLAGFVKKVKNSPPPTPPLQLPLPSGRGPGGGAAVLIHCWRGGMRSERFAELLEQAGFEVYTLERGYKAYRNFVLERFEQKFSPFGGLGVLSAGSPPPSGGAGGGLLILGGMTGSGKTEVLQYLVRSGHQVLNLEEIANHKGSAFGHLGQELQPTTEQFHNDISVVWQKFNLNKTIWIEDESQAIGTVRIPEPLFLQMRKSPVIKIELSREIRAKRLVNEYAMFDNEQLKKVILKIEKRLGGLNTKNALDALEKHDYLAVADITLRYYDKAYNYGLSKRSPDSVFSIKCKEDDPKRNAELIVQFVNDTRLKTDMIQENTASFTPISEISEIR